MKKKVFFERTVNGRWLSNFVPVSHIGTYMYECYLRAKFGDDIREVTITRPRAPKSKTTLVF